MHYYLHNSSIHNLIQMSIMCPFCVYAAFNCINMVMQRSFQYLVSCLFHCSYTFKNAINVALNYSDLVKMQQWTNTYHNWMVSAPTLAVTAF